MDSRAKASLLGALRAVPAGRLLDVPAGDMPLAASARELGWEVVGMDLFPASGTGAVRADACRTFPFRSASFDALLTLEGIEHFENQAAFVRECARVLRPGGLFLLTTPNVLHLAARLSGFWTAQRNLRRGFVNEDQTLRGRDGERLYHGHAFLVDAFRLRYLMAIAGLSLERLAWGGISGSSVLLAPLIPLIGAVSRLSLRCGNRARRLEGLRPASPAVEAELARLAAAPPLLLGKRLVVLGRRVASGETAPDGDPGLVVPRAPPEPARMDGTEAVRSR